MFTLSVDGKQFFWVAVPLINEVGVLGDVTQILVPQRPEQEVAASWSLFHELRHRCQTRVAWTWSRRTGAAAGWRQRTGRRRDGSLYSSVIRHVCVSHVYLFE